MTDLVAQYAQTLLALYPDLRAEEARRAAEAVGRRSGCPTGGASRSWPTELRGAATAWPVSTWAQRLRALESEA